MRETLAAFVDADRSADLPDLVERLELQSSQPFWQDYLERTLALMEPHTGARLLDIGCGTGTAVRRMARRIGATGQAIGIDASARMTELASTAPGNVGLPVRFIAGQAEALPFDDNSLDGARADRVYMYLRDPALATREALRVIAPGAMLVVSEPDMEGTWLDCSDVRLARKITRATAGAVPNSGAARALRATFMDAGFVDVAVEVRPLLMTSFAQMDKISSYQALTQVALQRGDMTRDEVDRWMSEMYAREQSGRAFGGTAFFIVSGRKPR